MEVFIEYLVKKKNSLKDIIQKFLICACAFILSIIALLVTQNYDILFLGLIIVAGIIYGTWYLIRSLNIEYEYIFTNGTLDIDKIIAQSRRKRMISLELGNIEKMAPANEKYKSDYQISGFSKIFNASSGDTKSEYFIKFSTKTYGLCLLIFNPNEKIIKASYHIAPRKVFET